MTKFSIKTFISEISAGGVARSDRYEIEFTSTKSGRRLFQRREIEKMNNRLESINLPGRGIGSSTVKLQTLDREIPYGNMYEGDIKMVFLEDKFFKIRKLFDTWQQLVISPVTYQISYYDNYTCDMLIRVYDEEDFEKYAVKIFDVFPKKINEIQMETNGENFAKTEIELSFRRWKEYIDPDPIGTDIYGSAGSDFNPDFIN